MFDWDDIRIFIAAARAGSLALAGQRLGIDPATVGRRLARLEARLKSTLVVRSAQGLTLTAAGLQLLETTRAAEEAMEAAEMAARTDLMSGTVRIGAAEGFGTAVLAPALPDLLAAHPGLKIELAATSSLLSANRRAVDMAITLSPEASPRLEVEPLTTYQLGLYAAPHHPAALNPPENTEDLKAYDFVGYIDDMIYASQLSYLDEIIPNLNPRMTSSSILAQREFIATGHGIGILPCFLSQGLKSILSKEIVITRQFWLQTHKEINNTARINSVKRWMKNLCFQNQHKLSPSKLDLAASDRNDM